MKINSIATEIDVHYFCEFILISNGDDRVAFFEV